MPTLLTIDALLPPEIAKRAVEVGTRKCRLPFWPLLTLAVLAGAFIALGAVFSTTVSAGTAGVVPFGLARLLTGVVFCLGLVLVVVAGAELFTGNALISMAWASGTVSTAQVLRNWGIVYTGNFIGALATAVLLFLSRQYTFGGGAVGLAALETARAKTALGFVQAVILGTLCNALVCLAVWLCLGARSTVDKILAIVFPISAFVAVGFEHSVANMYFIPIGLLIKGDIPCKEVRSAENTEPNNQQVVYVKGAPKEVLALCTGVRWQGQNLALDDTLRAQIAIANDDYARAGLRVLAVAQRSLAESLGMYTPETTEHDLTFLGLMAMMDPPRPEVAEAVEKCHRAGIRIIMITGDYGLTAESIARRIGIIRGPQPRLLTGAELGAMDDDALHAALRGEVIFARVAPEHKLRVVTALRDMGQIVAVTGDGVNDAPALKKADIGVAMGLTGTDVAKEAADMILTDDNFASIVNAVEEGRAVYANIKKFLTYIFTSNTPEAVPFILFAFTGGRIPLALNVMQILSIDLGTDIVPALALGAEAPEPGVMEKPPRSLQEHVITRALLLRAYPWLGAIQSIAAMAAFYFMYWTNGYEGQWLDLPAGGPLYRAATAMTLASVVATQIGNLFAQRTEYTSVFRIGLFSNRLIWVGIATELILLAAILYLPLLQSVFGTAPFPPANWLFLFAWTPVLLLADEMRKAVMRRRGIV